MFVKDDAAVIVDPAVVWEKNSKSVHREAEWQIWWQGTIKEAKGTGGYLEKYPFFH